MDIGPQAGFSTYEVYNTGDQLPGQILEAVEYLIEAEQYIGIGNLSIEICVIDGRFVFSRSAPVDNGNYGYVYAAYDLQSTTNNPLVALKIMGKRQPNANSGMILTDEYDCMKQIRGAGLFVPQPIGMGYLSNGAWLAMEYIQGINLEELINTRNVASYLGLNFPDVTANELFMQVASDLINFVDEASKLGIHHRDIKPSNIMVTLQDGMMVRACLIDWGLNSGSRIYNQAIEKGSVMGTAGFMSTARVKGKDEDLLASELFSVMSVLWNLCTLNDFSGTFQRQIQDQLKDRQVDLNILRNILNFKLSEYHPPIANFLEKLVTAYFDPNQVFNLGLFDEALSSMINRES